MKQFIIRFSNIEIDRTELKAHIRPDPLASINEDMIKTLVEMPPVELYETLGYEPGYFRTTKTAIASSDYSLIVTRGSYPGISMLHYKETDKQLIVYYQVDNDHGNGIYLSEAFSILNGFKGLPADIRDSGELLFTNDVHWKRTRKYMRFTHERVGQEAVIEALRNLTIRDLSYLMLEESSHRDLRDGVMHWLGHPIETQVKDYLSSLIKTTENIRQGNIL